MCRSIRVALGIPNHITSSICLCFQVNSCWLFEVEFDTYNIYIVIFRLENTPLSLCLLSNHSISYTSWNSSVMLLLKSLKNCSLSLSAFVWLTMEIWEPSRILFRRLWLKSIEVKRCASEALLYELVQWTLLFMLHKEVWIMFFHSQTFISGSALCLWWRFSIYFFTVTSFILSENFSMA